MLQSIDSIVSRCTTYLYQDFEKTKSIVPLIPRGLLFVQISGTNNDVHLEPML